MLPSSRHRNVSATNERRSERHEWHQKRDASRHRLGPHALLLQAATGRLQVRVEGMLRQAAAPWLKSFFGPTIVDIWSRSSHRDGRPCSRPAYIRTETRTRTRTKPLPDNLTAPNRSPFYPNHVGKSSGVPLVARTYIPLTS